MSSTNRGAKRSEKDFYETPSWCVELIVKEIVFPENTRFLEPCVGDEAIWDVVGNIESVTYMDWCEIRRGRDFLSDSQKWPWKFDFIITNPPYSLAQRFIEKSLTLANCIIMLLPLGFFGSEERHEWWMQHKPTAQHTLSKRPMFGKNKYGKWGTDSETYAWFVWDKTGRQATGFNWMLPDEQMYKESVKSFKARYELRQS